MGTAIHSFVNGELQIWYTEKIFSGQGQITRFRILHPIVLLHKTINMSMCVCVFTDVEILEKIAKIAGHHDVAKRHDVHGGHYGASISDALYHRPNGRRMTI